MAAPGYAEDNNPDSPQSPCDAAGTKDGSVAHPSRSREDKNNNDESASVSTDDTDELDWDALNVDHMPADRSTHGKLPIVIVPQAHPLRILNACH